MSNNTSFTNLNSPIDSTLLKNKFFNLVIAFMHLRFWSLSRPEGSGSSGIRGEFGVRRVSRHLSVSCNCNSNKYRWHQMGVSNSNWSSNKLQGFKQSETNWSFKGLMWLQGYFRALSAVVCRVPWRCLAFMVTSSSGSIFRVWSAPWINGWVNNREAGDLRRHRSHYGVIVMLLMYYISLFTFVS